MVFFLDSGHPSFLHTDTYHPTKAVRFEVYFLQCVGCLHLYSSAVLLDFKKHTEVKTIDKDWARINLYPRSVTG